ncbi:MAG: MtrB/PioB family decaheme-associated outer membrane protein [Rhodocyclaceae bacterium]|nr:MtrB/PioB family decaheme-associated outer membrane protein [Rhodocyclaceae bacterium]
MNKATFPFAISPLSLALVSALAHGSSAVGIDNQLGNEMNPSGAPVLCEPDPRGLTMYSRDSRTPTGFRYSQPCLTPDMDQTGEGWIVYGAIEGGVVGSGGDDDNAYFVEYADRDDGPTITVIDLSAQDSGSARYAHINAGNLGLDDAHLEVDAGKAGSYRARFTVNKIPHVYATNAKTPYLGVGTGRLRLPDAIPPNSISGDGAVGLNDTIAAQRDLTLRVDRERVGLSLDVELRQGLTAYLNYMHEQRDGIKAYGGSFNFDFLEALGNIGAVNEVIQPIDYSSNDVTAGIRLQGGRYNLDASYTGSFFRNDIDSLTYDNPWDTSGIFGGSYSPRTGQTDLAPDNDFHRVHVEGNHELPWWNGVATLALSRGRMEQDDRLLPFTSNSGVILGGLVDLDQWNTVASLERRRADARIDTGLEQLKLSFKPTERFGFKLGYRHYEEDNETPPFSTCNAINGQCAFVLLDGALAEAFQSPALFRLFDPENGQFANFHYRSVPWDHDKQSYTAAFSYRLTPRTLLGFDYELEQIERSYREVEETDENKFRLNLVHRDGRWGSLRVEAGFAERDYDGPYDSNPYEAFWTEHLLHDFIEDPATDPADAAASQNFIDTVLEPHTLAALRKSDLSKRDQVTLAVKFNVALNDQADLMLTADYKDNEYDAAYGLSGDTTSNFGAEFSYAPGAETSWFLSYHYQQLDSAVRNIDSTDIGSHDANPGGDYYPFANAWASGEDERSHFVSTGFETGLGSGYRLGLRYSYGLTKTRVGYAAASAAALTGSLAGSSISGSFDELRFQQQILEANLRGQLTKQLSWRLYALYEAGQIDDFHYDGIRYADRAKMLLGTEVDDWDAHVVGLLAQYRF